MRAPRANHKVLSKVKGLEAPGSTTIPSPVTNTCSPVGISPRDSGVHSYGLNLDKEKLFTTVVTLGD